MIVTDRETRRIIERLTGKTYAGEIRKNQEQIARNMLNMGMDVNTIAKATGLFVDDVLRL